ncbi:ABC transporter permease [Arcticibacter tournemirensis]|uniref:ABC transporter permease n=3 Tax=Pseudomonadati TaxID=3379134 RepID=A0A4Q0M6A1_9SPHI|nr:ABC transporter permease [Arcticibacter tournemirensis]
MVTMRLGINTEIAFTYLLAKRKQTLVASLGVTFGISMFIFMNSLITGTNEYFEKITLSSTPHIRLYNENRMSDNTMLNKALGVASINIISNPRLVNSDNRIYNPDAMVRLLKKNREVTSVSQQVSSNVIYSNGSVQRNGNVAGTNILEQDKMFDITSTLTAGSVKDLAAAADGIIIGTGLAKDLNLNKDDYINLTTSVGTLKRLQVVGIFRTTVKNVDNTKSYANIQTVQQLLKKDRSYITDIYLNLKNYTMASELGSRIENATGYRAESWQSANEQSIAARMIRDVIANSVVITILVVAGFGIYNILNMTIYEKIKEIAILKATGFAGVHVISIFIRQALFIGVIGGMMGVLSGWFISWMVSRMYIGTGNLSYLPVSFYFKHYLEGFLFGIVTAFFAGYIPARMASKVDPVSIIRG